MAQNPNNLLDSVLGTGFIKAGTQDPSVTATFGSQGTVYIRAGFGITPELWQKQDEGTSTNWLKFVTSASPVVTGDPNTVAFFDNLGNLSDVTSFTYFASTQRFGLKNTAPQAGIHYGTGTSGTVSSDAIVLGRMHPSNNMGIGAFIANGYILGTGNTASGNNAAAFGANTQATGNRSFAKGENTVASGFNSVAEGLSSIASGQNAHAEGNGTLASGNSSHAEGALTQATNYTAHAEGDSTQATNNNAHAEGYSTIASGPDSHSEGDTTIASGGNSHSEGFQTLASGASSHAENESTQATGDASHSSGRGTIAQARSSFAIGFFNVAQGTGGSRVAGDQIFIVGIGTSDASRATGFFITNEGNAELVGTFQSANIGLGSPNTFAYFDGTSKLQTLSGFSVDTTTGGALVGLTEQPDNLGGFSVHSWTTNFDPLQNSPNENWNIFNMGVNLDVNDSGFTQGTNGNAVQILNTGFNHQGTGDTGRLIHLNSSDNIGDGVNPITIGGIAYGAGGGTVNSGVTIDGQVQGYGIALTTNALAVAGASYNYQAFFDGSQIGFASNNHVSFNGAPTIASINNNSNYEGLKISPNITTLTGNATFYGAAFTPTITTIGATGGVNGVYVNPIITTMGATSFYHGADIYGTVTTSSGSIIGVNVSQTVNGGSATYTGLSINPQGVATLPSITGINIDLTGLASSASKKTALGINGGFISQNAEWTPTSALTVEVGNSINPTAHVLSGAPLTGTDPLITVFSSSLYAEDDIALGPASYGVGLFVAGGQVAVVLGKTVDEVNAVIAGFGFPVQSTGGTVTSASMFKTGAPVSAGGTLVITNLYGLNVTSGFSAAATNAWGFFIDDATTENYLSRLAIATTTKKVVNSAYGLNVGDSTNDILSGFGDTTLTTGDLRAKVRVGYGGTDPSVITAASRLGFLSTLDFAFTDNSAINLINNYQINKVDVATTKTLSGAIANHYSIISRDEVSDAGTVNFTAGYVGAITQSSVAKTTDFYATFMSAFHDIDTNGVITDMYDFYAKASTIGVGGVTNRYGIVVEPDANYTKINWLSGFNKIGGSSYSVPTVALEVDGESQLNGLTSLNAGKRIKTTEVTASPYNVDAADDYWVGVNVAGAATVNLPAGVDGMEYHIKDISGNASTNNITINANGADTFEGGGASYVANVDYRGLTLVFYDGVWYFEAIV